MRNNARSPTPAAVPGCGRRGIWMRIFGGSPLSTSSHSVGVAINSPSLSRPVMSAITVAGSTAGSLIFLPRFSIAPSSASSRRMRFSSARSAFFRPNSRAISRVPTSPGWARTKAVMASRPGKPRSRCFATLPAGLAGAFFRRRFGRRRGLRGRRLGGRRHRSARLVDRIGFRLCRGFFRRRLFDRLRRLRVGFQPGWLRRLGFSGASLRLAAALRHALVDQCDGFFERDGVLRLVARDGGVDAAGSDIGAVASALDRDAAKGWMIAQRFSRIGAETAAARAFCNFLGNQRDGSIQSDVEHLVAGLEAGIGLLMAHERAETAKTRGDRLAGLRMPADLARQRQQFQGQIEVDVGGRDVLRNAGALRLFAFRIILGLAELDIGTEPSGLHHDVEIRHRVLAEDAIGAGFAIGREWTGVTAFRVIGAADEGAEFSGLEVELAGTAARALPGIAAILARRIDVRPQHVVERIQHLGDAEILDLVDGADEVAPEIPQHLLPRDFVVGDAVELFFQIRGEIIFDVAREEVLQERDDDAALVLAMQALLLELDVAAVLQHLQDRGIGRGTADAELFHAFDQRSFGKARRRFGKMLGDGEVLALERLAFAHGGKAAAVLVVAVVVAAFLIERKEAVEFYHLAGGAQFQHTGAGLGRDVDGGTLQFGGFHLARDGADPDQFIKPGLVGIEAPAHL